MTRQALRREWGGVGVRMEMCAVRSQGGQVAPGSCEGCAVRAPDVE